MTHIPQAPVIPALSRALHQHDLTAVAAQRLATSARIRPGDRIIEPGAGVGSLTGALLAAGATVWAIELDAARAHVLAETHHEAYRTGRLHIAQQDALRHHPDPGGPWRVVGNPPFNRTAELLRHWLLNDHPAGPPLSIDILLQRQTAEKCEASRWGGHTRTSILVNLWGTPRPGNHFSRDATTPPSHVPLRTLHLRRHLDAPSPARLRQVDNLLEQAFAGPHTVIDALRGCIPARVLMRFANEHAFDPTTHPRNLPPTAWLAMAMGPGK